MKKRRFGACYYVDQRRKIRRKRFRKPLVEIFLKLTSATRILSWDFQKLNNMQKSYKIEKVEFY